MQVQVARWGARGRIRVGGASYFYRRGIGWHPSLFDGDFVIAAAPEFDETNSVTERIGHVGDAGPVVRLDLALDRGAGFDGAPDSSLEFRDDEIKMYWCPMSPIATHLLCID